MFQVVVAIFGGFFFLGDLFSENREFVQEHYFSEINSQNDDFVS
jgi:hypothetical protein